MMMMMMMMWRRRIKKKNKKKEKMKKKKVVTMMHENNLHDICCLRSKRGSQERKRSWNTCLTWLASLSSSLVLRRKRKLRSRYLVDRRLVGSGQIWSQRNVIVKRGRQSFCAPDLNKTCLVASRSKCKFSFTRVTHVVPTGLVHQIRQSTYKWPLLHHSILG